MGSSFFYILSFFLLFPMLPGFFDNLFMVTLAAPKEAALIANFHSDRTVRYMNSFAFSHVSPSKELAAGCHLPDYAKSGTREGGFTLPESC